MDANAMFIDFNTAFDSIHHKDVWEALQNQGVEFKYIKF